MRHYSADLAGARGQETRQTWLVPEDKRQECRAISDMLTAQLDVGPPDPWALSRFAGKTVCCRRACDSLKHHQNLQCSVLSGRPLKWEQTAEDHRWWLHPKESQRPLSAKLRKLLKVEIATCVALVLPTRPTRSCQMSTSC